MRDFMASPQHQRVCASLVLVALVFPLAVFAQAPPRIGPQHSPGMMRKMGATESNSSVTEPSALPGFPGAAQIYHLGATGFFLDYAAGIGLSSEQQADLNELKERSIGYLTAMQLRIDQAEQALWALTGSDRPDATAIERKVREIEKLRADRRIAFIRSIGEAARSLTDAQRAALVAGIATETGQMTAPQDTGSMEPNGEDAGLEREGSGEENDAETPETSNSGNGKGNM